MRIYNIDIHKLDGVAQLATNTPCNKSTPYAKSTNLPDPNLTSMYLLNQLCKIKTILDLECSSGENIISKCQISRFNILGMEVFQRLWKKIDAHSISHSLTTLFTEKPRYTGPVNFPYLESAPLTSFSCFLVDLAILSSRALQYRSVAVHCSPERKQSRGDK